MRTAIPGEEPFVYTWSFPICPYRVCIDLGVVEGLQQEMAARAEPGHGVLFGRIGPSLTRIDGWRSIPALDRDAMAAVDPPPECQVIGYYSIREGTAFLLSPAEVAVANELFNRQGCVMLLVERRSRGPAEATFYFSRAGTFVHNLPLPFPFHSGMLLGEGPQADSNSATASFSGGSCAQRRAFRMALFAVLTIAAAGLVTAYLRDGMPKVRHPASEAAIPDAGPQWIATEPKRDLELTWDPRVDTVSSATAGVLKIEDGDVVRQMSLDAGDLMLGGMLYAPAAVQIRVELTTLQRDGKMLRVAVSARPADLASAPAAAIPSPAPAPTPEATSLEATPPAATPMQARSRRKRPHPPRRFTGPMRSVRGPGAVEAHAAPPVTAASEISAEPEAVTQAPEEVRRPKTGNRFIRALGKLNPFHRGVPKTIPSTR